jgi:hypothetical protein
MAENFYEFLGESFEGRIMKFVSNGTVYFIGGRAPNPPVCCNDQPLFNLYSLDEDKAPEVISSLRNLFYAAEDKGIKVLSPRELTGNQAQRLCFIEKKLGIEAKVDGE